MKTPAPPKGRAYVLKEEVPIHGYDAWVVGVQSDLRGLKPKPLASLRLDHATVEIRPTERCLWLVGKWQGAHIAFLTAYSPMGRLKIGDWNADRSSASLEVRTEIGQFRIQLCGPEAGAALLRVQITFTPISNLRFPFWPRDVYPIDEAGNPMNSRGVVHATQRGTCTGLLFLTTTQPVEASLFYLQNLTWLNGYAQTTETELKGVVADSWPDLGYRPPASEHYAMTAGEEEEWSDFFVRFCDITPTSEGDRARLFMESLAEIYRHLPPPDTEYRDWPQRAQETIRSLESPKVWTEVEGQAYLRPYVNAEHPDSMVQSVLLSPLMRYSDWSGKHVGLIRKLRKPLASFYDEKSKAYRRWLSSAAPDHNPNEMDSWYLYHPLINLASLARADDEEARELLRKGASYGVKVARHFNYHWPVNFDLMSLETKQENRKPGQPGETDVPGLYAYVMLECFEIFGEDWYREEALRALQQLKGLGFEIGYQMNNVAWAALACARTWRMTGDPFYLDTSHAFIASFFHNTTIWEPDYGLTRTYSSFMAVKCLHDADYSAMFEEYESFTAFHKYLEVCGDDVPPSLQLLVTEYIRFLLSRGWYYYPSELPGEVLAKEVRNGEIDRELMIPLEDIYQERHPAGSVGQETYGAAAAFDFVVHAFHQVPKAPFILYCEYPITGLETGRGNATSFSIRGDERLKCRVRLIPIEGKALPPVRLHLGKPNGRAGVKPQPTGEGHLEYKVKGGSHVTVVWGRRATASA